MTRPILVLLAANALALVLAPIVPAAATHVRASDVDGVWVNGTVHNLVVTGPAQPNAKRVTPLYVIAPVSASHPLHPLADAKLHGFGAHDHVAQIANPNTPFHGVCDLTLVVPGPKAKPGKNIQTRPTLTPTGPHALLYAAHLGNKMLSLTWASRIQQAQRLGLAKLVDTSTLLACTITPRSTG